ncbi:MAG: thermonuclease family protein [Xenococcaceae cyanobacterium]
MGGCVFKQHYSELLIRSACIDAPEKKMPNGIASRDYLRSATQRLRRALLEQGNNQVKVNPIAKDRYGRAVAELWIKINNNWQLVQLSAS